MLQHSRFGLGLAAAALLLTGCSSGSPSTDGGSATAAPADSAAAETTPAETASKDTMTVAVFSQFTDMDPATNGELVNSYVLHHMYATMFRTDKDGQPQKELCTDYEVSEDGLTHTFKLREDAVWSDGTPLTANDFVYSYLRALSYGVDSSNQIYNMTVYIQGAEEYNLHAIEVGDSFDCTTEDHSSVGIEAPDDYTLVLTLKQPCTFLPLLMSSGAWIPLPQTTPQHNNQWAFEPGYPVSHGYNMTYININDKCVLQKNDSFYNAADITMPEIVWQVVPDSEAQHLAFEAGDLDVATEVSSDTARSYEGTDSLWVAMDPSTYCIIINTGEKGPEWAKDVRVRRALAMAVDQTSITEVIGSTFYPVLSSYLPFGLEGINGDFRQERDDQGGYTLVYNPEESKRLLAEAGYDESNPLHIEYYYSTNSMHGDVATCLQQMWGAVGVDVTFKAVEAGVYYDGWYAGDYEIARYGVALTHPITAMNSWTTAYQQVATVADPVYDERMADIQATTDAKEALQKVHDLEDYLVDQEAHLIPMFQFTMPMLKNPDLQGYEMHVSYPYFGYASFK
ncbi:MAG: peptide ABC transporter substrate-binding protein [Erysipelotrichaceae bacterium]|nr:peptide ABC transporter substrate-binding protein [Erysipelotrichaceae bacterium]